MRLFGLITAALVTIASPVSAEVLAVCGNLNAQLSRAPAAILSSAQGLPEAVFPAAQAQLALVRDSEGFDLLLNWGELNQKSLRAEGADILGNEMAANFVHLVVARNKTGSLEHFLFSLRDQGFGELLWTAAPDSKSDDAEIVTAESVCVRPQA